MRWTGFRKSRRLTWTEKWEAISGMQTQCGRCLWIWGALHRMGTNVLLGAGQALGKSLGSDSKSRGSCREGPVCPWGGCPGVRKGDPAPKPSCLLPSPRLRPLRLCGHCALLPLLSTCGGAVPASPRPSPGPLASLPPAAPRQMPICLPLASPVSSLNLLLPAQP